MIKKIIVLSLFVISNSLSAMEEEFVELDCSRVAYACKGRYYEIETQFNGVSSEGQKLWTFQDPVMDMNQHNVLEDPLSDYEYNALKVHTCLVTRRGGYFSNMLIAKLEVNPRNYYPRRALQTFLTQSISSGGGAIYAWVERESSLLNLLETDYGFKKSNEALFIPLTDTKVSYPSSNIIQLEASKKDIREVFSPPTQNL